MDLSLVVICLVEVAKVTGPRRRSERGQPLILGAAQVFSLVYIELI